ncbi:MAG: hypothetical protein KY463_08425 [Actinobacteria bacterium]|nr:hypothetical protein [Actinomycetota bacterium]
MPPSFCRHNRFVQNCPICSPATLKPPPAARRQPGAAPTRSARSGTRSARSSAVRVRHLHQAVDDGYRSELVTGIKATSDAERLATELAFATARLAELAAAPPALYADIVSLEDVEEALWLAFLTAYVCPLPDVEDPFANVREAHVPWASGELPRLDVARGPRGAVDPATGERTILAYRAWVRRAGSQRAAIAGEPAWTPGRRFDRIFERLALPGLGRDARYELLVSLGRLDLVDLCPSSLQFGDGETTIAAKRVFGIGDKILLERRARILADAVDVPIEALDLALFNWGARGGARATYGSSAVVVDAEREAIADVLGA